MLIEHGCRTVAALAVAGMALLCASASVCAFEAVGKVISVSTSREVVNEPYPVTFERIRRRAFGEEP